MHAYGQWVVPPEFGHLVNGHVMYMALHRAKQVMVEVGYVDGLIDDQMEHPPGRMVCVSHHPTNSLVNMGLEGFVVAHNGNWSIIVKYNQGMLA
jgi:hypothetical protein